jgi:4a-hydroxytetrahydrobiopterin dehydratase
MPVAHDPPSPPSPVLPVQPAPTAWTRQKRPPAMTQRFAFSSYATTRDFLDRLAAWSEQSGVYPDLSFGTTYVNVTVNLPADATASATADAATDRAGSPQEVATDVVPAPPHYPATTAPAAATAPAVPVESLLEAIDALALASRS